MRVGVKNLDSYRKASAGEVPSPEQRIIGVALFSSYVVRVSRMPANLSIKKSCTRMPTMLK